MFFPNACIRVPLLALLCCLLLDSGCSRGETFPLADYQKAPANLQGNHYVLEAEVDSQLGGKEGVGRFIAVRTLKDKNRLPLYVADTLQANLLPAQRYRFDITVRKGGLLSVNRLTKI